LKYRSTWLRIQKLTLILHIKRWTDFIYKYGIPVELHSNRYINSCYRCCDGCTTYTNMWSMSSRTSYVTVLFYICPDFIQRCYMQQYHYFSL
jgi:hypothetical protein